MVSYVLSVLLIEKEGIAVKAQVPILTNNPSQTCIQFKNITKYTDKI